MSYMWKTCGIYLLTTPRPLHESRRNTMKLLQEAHLHILHHLHLQPQPRLLVRPWNCGHQSIYNSPPPLKVWSHMTIAAISGFIVQFPELSCELSGGRLTMTDSLPRHHQKKYDSIVMLSVWLWYPTPGLIRSRWFSNDLLNVFMHYSCWLFFVKTLVKNPEAPIFGLVFSIFLFRFSNIL